MSVCVETVPAASTDASWTKNKGKRVARRWYWEVEGGVVVGSGGIHQSEHSFFSLFFSFFSFFSLGFPPTSHELNLDPGRRIFFFFFFFRSGIDRGTDTLGRFFFFLSDPFASV